MPDAKIMDFVLLDNRRWEIGNWTYNDMKEKMTGIMSILKLRKPATVVKELVIVLG